MVILVMARPTGITSNIASGVVSMLMLSALTGLALKPRNALVRAFTLLMIVSPVVVITDGDAFAQPAGILAVHIAATGLQPILCIDFARRFITRRTPVPTGGGRKSLLLLSATGSAALLAAIVALATLWLDGHLESGIWSGLQIVRTAGIVASLMLLGTDANRQHRSHRGWSTAIVALGLGVALLPEGLAAGAQSVLGYGPLLTWDQEALLLLAFPLALGFASGRWRKGGVLQLIDRVSVYVILALAILVVYIGIVAVAEELANLHISQAAQLLTLGLASLAAITYEPARRRLQRAIDIVLYRDYYEVGPKLQEFSLELAMLREETGVINLLLDRLSETLNLSGVAFVALPEGLDPHLLSLIEADDLQVRGDYATPEGRQAVLRGLAGLKLTIRTLARHESLILDPWPGCAALVLVGAPDSGERLAILVIGPKRTGGGLRHDDQTLLATVAHQAATALSNALLVAGLRTSLAQVRVSTAQLVAARSEQQLLLRELVNAEERQRAALARDLHDDALQEVLYTVRHAHLCRELAASLAAPSVAVPGEHIFRDTTTSRPATRPHVLTRLREELDQLAERSTVAERKLRALYLGLYPALLSTLGLAAALDDLAHDLSTVIGVPITISCADEAATATSQLSDEVALHVYRVTQEALQNVGKHARASSAHVHLDIVPDEREEKAGHLVTTRRLLRLAVHDDGHGMALPVDFIALLREGHLGLAGMRDRAERIGGWLEIQPASPGGTRLVLYTPLPATAATHPAQVRS